MPVVQPFFWVFFHTLSALCLSLSLTIEVSEVSQVLRKLTECVSIHFSALYYVYIHVLSV